MDRRYISYDKRGVKGKRNNSNERKGYYGYLSTYSIVFY
jgi:hypothetical protein